MDRSDLLSALDQGPVRVYMIDGKTYEIPDHKSCLVDSTTAYVLYRREDGKLKAHWLAKSTLASFGEHEPDRNN